MEAIPADFRRALKRSGLLGFFNESAFVHRPAFLSWIAEARTSQTRRMKIASAVRRLAAQREADEAAAQRRSA